MGEAGSLAVERGEKGPFLIKTGLFQRGRLCGCRSRKTGESWNAQVEKKSVQTGGGKACQSDPKIS